MNVVRLRDKRGFNALPLEESRDPSANASAFKSLLIEEMAEAHASAEVAKPTPIPISPWLVVPTYVVRGTIFLLHTIVLTIGLSIRTIYRYLYRHPIHAMLNALFAAVLVVLISTGAELHKQMILSKISSEIVDRIIAASRFTRAFDAEEINRGGVRELLRAGAPNCTQRESVRAILYQARKAGLSLEDQAVLLAIADVESGFNPMARASTTSACGLFQFVRKTGELFSLSTAECMDPWLNAESGVKHYIHNYERRVRGSVENLNGAEKVFRTFELSYYLHHDGSAYTAQPSSEVKATILNGTQFLFKAYHALEDEAESQQQVPAFSETLSAKVWKGLDELGVFFDGLNIPLVKRFRGNAIGSEVIS